MNTFEQCEFLDHFVDIIKINVYVHSIHGDSMIILRLVTFMKIITT